METLGQTLADCRKSLRYKQADVSNQLKLRFGMDVSIHSISHWERDVATPNAKQFLALCEIYNISNINETFKIYLGHDPISILNDEGRKKVYEFADILLKTGLYER